MRIYSNKVNIDNNALKTANNPTFSGLALRSYPYLVRDMAMNSRDLPCPYCGHIMMNIKQFQGIRHELASRTACNFAEIFHRVNKFVRGRVREQVRDEILDEALSSDYSQERLHHIAMSLAMKHKDLLTRDNIDVLRGAKGLAELMVTNKFQRNVLSNYFANAMQELKDTNSADFQKLNFMQKSAAFMREKAVASDVVDTISERLRRLPAPSTNVHAFFVRNGDLPFNPDLYDSSAFTKSPMDILVGNLFSPALITIDHIVPMSIVKALERTQPEIAEKLYGATNLLLACGEDNLARENSQLSDFANTLGADKVLQNMRKFFDSLPRRKDYLEYTQGVIKMIKIEGQGLFDKL